MRLTRRISFYEQLATMTDAGLPLRQSLDRLGARFPSPEIRTLQQALGQQSTAEEAFTSAGFSPFEIKVIAAGERSGHLVTSFKQLGGYWKTENELIGAMWKQMAYPIILLHLVALLGPLPKLITGSLFTYLFSVVLQLGFLYGAAFLAREIVRQTWRSETGQAFWLRVPLVGRFWQATYAYRWIVALRMELNAGISYFNAVADAWEATGFGRREQRAQEARDGLTSGESLSNLVGRWGELPLDWADYFATAEVSGKINDTLEKVEAHALHEWKQAQDRLADWLPKLVYVLLVLFAGYQILSLAMNTFGEVQKALDSVSP